MKRLWWRWLVVAVLCLAIWASAFGPLDRWVNEAALGRVSQSNTEYLENSFAEATKVFLVLTGVKTVLAIIEGSEVSVSVGAGATLELGDVVQAAYDYIDFAWRVMLLATLALYMTQMLLETALWADSPLLTLTLISLLLYLGAKWGLRAQWGREACRILRDCSYLLVTVTLAAYLLLPLSVAAGAKLSGEITALRKQEAGQELVKLQQELDAKYNAIATADGVFAKAGKITETVKTMGSYLAARTMDLFWRVVSLCAAYIFDTVVFPLGLFVLLFWFARLLARYFFGLRQQKAFKEDLEELMGRYFGTGDRTAGRDGHTLPDANRRLPEALRPPEKDV